MAWQLTHEVQRLCPPGLSQGERSVLAAVAAEARLATRSCDLDLPEMARAAGLSRSGLRAAVRRLRDHGVELRVPIPDRVGRDGRPLYAVPGQRLRWHLPPMEEVAQVLREALVMDQLERAAARPTPPERPDRPGPADMPIAPAIPGTPDVRQHAGGTDRDELLLAAVTDELAAEQELTSRLHGQLDARDELIADLRIQLELTGALARAALDLAAHLDRSGAASVHSPALDDAAAALGKGGTSWRQGGHELAARGAHDAPPSVVGRGVPASAPAREAAPAACGQPDPHVSGATGLPAAQPAPTWADLIARVGDSPPRCPLHSDWSARRRPPDCRDCALLRRSWTGQRTELVRAEARARRACNRCDELGWDLAVPNGEPAARCPHPGHGPARPSTSTRPRPTPQPFQRAPTAPVPGPAEYHGRHRKTDPLATQPIDPSRIAS